MLYLYTYFLGLAEFLAAFLILAVISPFLYDVCQVLEPSESALTFEGLIDALLVLYEECGQDKVKSRNELVSAFLAKFQPQVLSFYIPTEPKVHSSHRSLNTTNCVSTSETSKSSGSSAGATSAMSSWPRRRAPATCTRSRL